MSIASTVLLDPQRGTATKLYRPPPVVRLLYWFAFQARFPYESSMVALEAARHRREIASRLTTHRFGKDLVAHVTAVNCIHDRCTFVTEYVPGEKAKNDGPAKEFLSQVAETFAGAGLSVWQVNPRNPHAHTNLIRTPEGDFKIIDLESAVVTLLPAPGQWRSSLRSGNVPVFDDIDFPRLKGYVAANSTALEASLGVAGLAELNESIASSEQAIRSWKDAEPRVWGRLVGRTYRLLDWKAFLQHLMHSLVGAKSAGEAFLGRGITRWETEDRLAPSEVAWLRNHLATPEVADALRHLGAHLVLSVILRFPIGSAARLAWTLTFWGTAWSKRFRRQPGTRAGRRYNIHSPLVMVLSLIPGLGAIAYLAARPLRHKLLIRLMVDQIAWKLPFKLYRRLHLGRWLAPTPRKTELSGGRAIPSGIRERQLPLSAGRDPTHPTRGESIRTD
jgi:hypothetical protein